MPANAIRDSRLFRDVMGRFATGVTVVTLDADGEARGMTANAISSVSLDPMLLLVCIDREASMHEHFERGDAFAVNILTEHQREIAALFARHGQPAEEMAGVPWHRGSLHCPVLDETIAFAICRIVARHPAGDHTIVVGEVEDMAVDRPQADPLLFFAGGYRRMDGQA